MASDEKTFDAVLNGRGTVAFRDLEHLLLALGFKLARTSGSHRIYVHPAAGLSPSNRKERTQSGIKFASFGI